jgi:hypothetical protein
MRLAEEDQPPAEQQPPNPQTLETQGEISGDVSLTETEVTTSDPAEETNPSLPSPLSEPTILPSEGAPGDGSVSGETEAETPPPDLKTDNSE